jgi:glycosyltransferase involved in cell wall biosynthesis
MRLALIGPVYPYRGGIAHYTTLLHEALLREGHEVLLVSFRRQYPRWLFPGKDDRDPSQQPLSAQGAKYWLDSVNPLTWITTFLRIRRFRPQGLVLQWWTTFWSPLWITLALLNALWLRTPLTFLCHNVLPHGARRWEHWAARLTLRWGCRFVVQSAAERDRLRALVRHGTIHIVPHPIYDMFADQRPPRGQARAQLNLPATAKVLLFFGIVRPYKGLADLIQALPAVRRREPQVRLLIAGEFWEAKARYLELIQQANIADIVQIDDRYIPNEEVARYFSAADLLVAPYRQQTGSGVVEMARGFGLPALTMSDLDAEVAATQEPRPQVLARQIVARLHQAHPPTAATASATTNAEAASWQRLVHVLAGGEG